MREALESFKSNTYLRAAGQACKLSGLSRIADDKTQLERNLASDGFSSLDMIKSKSCKVS